jgi:hypothetical protein
LIGSNENQLIPAYSENEKSGDYKAPRRKNSARSDKRRKGNVLTQHTGLPPRSKK